MKPCEIQYIPAPSRAVAANGPRGLADELSDLIEVKERMAAEGWEFAGTQEVLVFRRAAKAEAGQDRQAARFETEARAAHPTLRQLRLVKDTARQEAMAGPRASAEGADGAVPCDAPVGSAAPSVAARYATPMPGEALRRFRIRKVATS